MSAVPKKKLCWNCEGNVSKEVNNCPYCGVYLHAEEFEENSKWNPNYSSQTSEDEVPSPIYQIKPDTSEDQELKEHPKTATQPTQETSFIALNYLYSHLKQEMFPLLFLMMGSIFFLFGIVLLLFSQNGTLTLQWEEKYSIYFLFFSLPLIGLGWYYFHHLEE